jgi:hypothetical protein
MAVTTVVLMAHLASRFCTRQILGNGRAHLSGSDILDVHFHRLARQTLIIRFGGTNTYHKTLPALLGWVFGDVTMMLFWVIVYGCQGRTGHRLLPP